MSDVIGSVLLVAITILMAAAFAFLLFQFKGPEDAPAARIAITLNAGLQGWGTGDESIRVVHNGGEALAAANTHIVYKVNGQATNLEGATQLGGAFADGQLSLGETWTRAATLAATDTVTVGLIHKGGRSNLVASSVLVPANLPSSSACIFDVLPPSVATLTQVPADVRSTTVGAVTVSVTLVDGCWGVSQTDTPELWWRINDGTNPAFTKVSPPLTLASQSNWTGAIPAAAWASKAGQTLEYEFRGMKDMGGNVGTSSRQTDLVDLVAVMDYVGSHTAIAGTVTNFANAQTASDSAAVAELTEVATPGTNLNLAATATVSSGGWSNPGNGFASDNLYATTNSDQSTIRYALADPAGTGTITQVLLKLEQSISIAAPNDQWTLQACFNAAYLGGACSAASAPITASGSSAETTISYNVTNLRPGGGSWTWTDITNLELLAKSSRVGTTDGTWRIDQALVTVGAVASHRLDVRFDWTGVPAGAAGTHILQISQSVSADTFNLQVWNWATSTFVNRGTLSSPTLATFSYTLTPNEYNSGTGAVRIQFTDATPSGTSQGVLRVDYARVTTS